MHCAKQHLHASPHLCAQGVQYWLFNSNKALPGYPRPLTNLGLPASLSHVDAAMVWGHNGKTYFFSGEQYWRYDEFDASVELDYPRHIRMWRGVPRNVDAAFQYTDGQTYFFKGQNFWRFNDRRMHVYNRTQHVAEWFGCPVAKPSYADEHSCTQQRCCIGTPGNNWPAHTQCSFGSDPWQEVLILVTGIMPVPCRCRAQQGWYTQLILTEGAGCSGGNGNSVRRRSRWWVCL
ncbi:hypothetical protein HPB48_005833 [Haemaphysalis longicornis]|uniref:Matrix metalloproteinase n=1 Tax=Haemaphysalis longicornis TaxID=44386 RepID=A0A9J6GDW9_HAELO|nr:hypothetical protein HPB48_005833 [Haemaphysalis longicornis]